MADEPTGYVGTGITRVPFWSQTIAPDQSAARTQPETWETHLPDEQWLEAEIAYWRSLEPTKPFWPHEDIGWFLERILSYRGLLHACAQRGGVNDAIMYAIEAGKLMTEMSMKKEWERYALTGQKFFDKQDVAAAEWRRGSQEDRVAAVDALCASGRVSKNRAYAMVALREGSHPKTIEGDYLKAKKKHPKPGA